MNRPSDPGDGPPLLGRLVVPGRIVLYDQPYPRPAVAKAGSAYI